MTRPFPFRRPAWIHLQDRQRPQTLVWGTQRGAARVTDKELASGIRELAESIAKIRLALAEAGSATVDAEVIEATPELLFQVALLLAQLRETERG